MLDHLHARVVCRARPDKFKDLLEKFTQTVECVSVASEKILCVPSCLALQLLWRQDNEGQLTETGKVTMTGDGIGFLYTLREGWSQAYDIPRVSGRDRVNRPDCRAIFQTEFMQ